MKKFLIILFAVFAFGAAKAQVVKLTNPNGLLLDTASQAAAEGPAVGIGKAKTIGIIVVTTKISGTIAGTVAFQGSNDGVQYSTIGTPTALADASTNYQYKEVDKAYRYYKALITQTGTSSLSYKATVNVTP